MKSAQRINRVGSDLTRPHSLRHQRSIKQTVVLYSPLLVGVALLMADLVLRDAGIAARFSVGAVRPFRFGRTAQAGTHKLLAGVVCHAACLRVAVHHPLLLRSNLGDGWCDLTTRGVFPPKRVPKPAEPLVSCICQRTARGASANGADMPID